MQACRKRKLIELTDANRNPSPPFICLFSVCFYPEENRNSVRRESNNLSPGLQTNVDQIVQLFYYQKWIKITLGH